MRISDWSSDVCSSDLERDPRLDLRRGADLVREDVRLGGEEQDVVEGEPFLGELRREAGAVGGVTTRRAAVVITNEGAGRVRHGGSLVGRPRIAPGPAGS